MNVDISLVIPLFNEQDSLTELTSWIKKVCDSNNYKYEILLINDGSTDDSWNIISIYVKKTQYQRNFLS